MNRAQDAEAAAADWLARRDGERWSEDDDRALDAWLDADSANRVAYLRLRAAWDRADRLRALHAPQSAPGHAPNSRRPLSLVAGGAVAASLAAVVVLAGLAFFGARSPKQVMATPVGGRETVSLADGSRMILNTASRATATISAQRRVVVLERGEAFFDVRHDPKHPFTVIAGDHRITDVGTRFSVRRDGDDVRVVVEEGSVRIDRLGAAPAVVGADAASANALTAPQIVTVGGLAVASVRETLVVHRGEAAVERDLAWREGVLSFNQTTLGEAAGEFNRYNVKQLAVDKSAAGIRIDGAFKSDNVTSFARLLRDGFGLKVEDKGDRIVISE
jgi:transmembrane sensor